MEERRLVDAGLFGAMQAVRGGGACCVEESRNVTRVCQTVLFYILASSPPPPLEVMLQCERACRLFACLCLFLIAARAALRFPTDVPRGAAASTLKQTHSPDVMSHSSVGQRSSREAAGSFFFSLSSRAVTGNLVWTSPLS